MRNRFVWIFSALLTTPALAQPGPDAVGPSPVAEPKPSAPLDAAAQNPATPPNPVIVVPPSEPQPERPAPAPEAPPPPASPIQAPATPPPFTPVERDEGVAAEAEALAEPRDFGLELDFALSDRLSTTAGYTQEHALGAALGAALWLSIPSRTALGLELVYTDLGRGSAATGQNFVQSEFSSTGLWLGGRFFTWQNQSTRVFLALKVGLALQHVAASGVHQSAPLAAASPFDCSGTSGPHFGLGAGLGAIFRVTSRLDFIPRLDFRNERLTSDEVGGCATGLGSSASLSLGLGVAYGFDGPSRPSTGLAARAPAQTW